MSHFSKTTTFSINCILAVFLLFISIQFEKCAAVTKNCPNFCKCDLFNGLNRANCSSKRLIGANIEIPATVEILDLSYNDITTLDGECFKSFVHLIKINVSHNAIHTIYVETFEKLQRIKTIDLSYNRLEYLDSNLIMSNRQLEFLNLEGNKFMTLSNKPFLNSVSLRNLNLHNSQISYVPNAFLTSLPKLESLDLSQNQMITINLDAFYKTTFLKVLNLQNNRWKCDKSITSVINELLKYNVHTILTDCQMKQKSNKTSNVKSENFARLQMLPQPIYSGEVEQEIVSEEIVEDTFDSSTDASLESEPVNWHDISASNEEEYYYDDYETSKHLNSLNLSEHQTPSLQDISCDGTRQQICERHRQCVNKLIGIFMNGIEVPQNSKEFYTRFDVNLAFLLGTAVGVATCVFIISFVLCVKNCCEVRKKRVSNNAHTIGNTHTNNEQFFYVSSQAIPNLNTSRPTQPTPLVAPASAPPAVVRRPRRARRSAPIHVHNSQAVVRADANADNFFARLFGRPARHQYYRTINENTATLIRRLSRSNLFNNRLSQHFVERSGGGGGRHTPSAPNSPNDVETTTQFYLFNDDTPTVPLNTQRAETPPPNYVDVVVLGEKQKE